MISIGIFEAKAHLGQLVQSAAEGEVILLTRRGKPVAELRAPQEEFQQQDAAAAVKSLRAFSAANHAGDFNIADLVAEGRR